MTILQSVQLKHTSFVIHIILVLYGAFIAYKGIKGFKNCSAIYKIFSFSFYICLILYTLNSVSQLVLLLHESGCIWNHTFSLISLFSYYSVLGFLVFTFVARLKCSFDGTRYRLTDRSFIVIIVISVILLILVTVNFILSTIYGINSKNAFDVVSRILAILLYVVLCSILVGLFAKKLNNFSIDQRDRSMFQMSERNRGKSIEAMESIVVSLQQEESIDTIAKYLSLSSIQFGTTTIVAIALIFTFIFNTSYAILSIGYSIDIAVNITCMYLQFSFAENDYNNLCSYVSNGFKHCLTEQITKKMDQRTKPQQIGSSSNSTIATKTQTDSSVVSNTSVIVVERNELNEYETPQKN